MGFPRMDTGFDKFRASEPQNRQGDYNRSAGRMQLVAGSWCRSVNHILAQFWHCTCDRWLGGKRPFALAN